MYYKFIILFIFFITIKLYSQVGINTSNVNPNSMLHISEKNDLDEISSKGIIIPRLNEFERDDLTYFKNTSDIKLNNFDNSLLIFNTTENCFNYWNNLKKEWKSLCGNDTGEAIFSYDCSSAFINGEYIKNNILDESHFITLKVNVVKKGNYKISLNPHIPKENGYSFTASGIFNTLGDQYIKLVGQGKPKSKSINDSDKFIISSSGDYINPTLSCIDINVQEKLSKYNLDCSNIIVNGNFIKGKPLDSSNTIIINVNVIEEGFYNLKVDLINGISFSSSGLFLDKGRKNITLYGEGIPNTNSDFNIKFRIGEKDYIDCSTKIYMTLPAMKYALIGNNSVYSWEGEVRKNLLNNSSSFGINGIVKIEALSGYLYNVSQAVSNLMVDKPDLVLYFSYGQSVTPQLATVLSTYVNSGGVLVFGTEDNNFTSANNLLNGIFGLEYSNVAQQQISRSSTVAPNNSQDDNVYLISNDFKDPIINGPFGNLSGKYWGEDNSSTGTIIVTKLPPNSVQIATANNQWSKFTVDPTFSTVWYNNNKNFVYFGDSTGASIDSSSEIDYPTIYKNNLPFSKRYGQYPNNQLQSQYVVNSALELNVISWALKKAATNGINPH